MSKERITVRVIGGKTYRCRDLGADDYDRAEYNRYIGEHKLFLAGYIATEEAVKRTPISQPLPSWIPQGRLPQVGAKESREIRQQFSGGGNSGFEVFEPKVVGAI